MDTLLRSIFLFFDRLVYSFIPSLYNLFIEVANLSIVSDSAIKSFASRIYALIGVFMLFKVTFSLITLLVNPDAITDKEKGLNGIVKRVTISLVLLSFVPWLFNFAFEVQNIILEKNVLANIILGGNYGGTISDISDDPGDAIAYGILASFIQPDDQYSEWATNNGLFEEELKKEPREQSDEAKAYKQYRESIEYKDPEMLMDLATEKDDNGDFIFNYISFFSTIAGIFACYAFIVYLIQIGFRSVKLSFLQLIAPIPILSYVDPKTSEKTFKAWKDECISTFLDIFVRLIIIYFVILLISLLTKDGVFTMYHWGTDKNAKPSLLASAFVIIGLLMFAMEAPKLVPQMLGLKSTGNFSLSPSKALGAAALPLGLGIGAIGAGGLAMAGNIFGNHAKNKKLENDKDAGKITQEEYDKYHRSGFNQFRSAIGGFGSGLFRGGISGAKNKNGFKGASIGAKASTRARKSREEGMSGINAMRNWWTDISGQEGSTGTVNELKDKIKVQTQKMEQAERNAHMYEHALSQMMGSNDGKNAAELSKIYAGGYSNYHSYLMGNDSYKKDYDSIMNSVNYTIEEKEELAKALQSEAERYGLVNEQLFGQFTSAQSGMQGAIEEKKQLEKSITRLQETKDINKKK